jgi:integrase
MPLNPKNKKPIGGAETKITLQDVINAVKGRDTLSVTRRRDLRSAVTRVASLLDEDPGRIALNLPVLSAKLAAVNPASASLTSKTFSNIRSDFLAAVKASELTPVRRLATAQLNADWTKLMAPLRVKRGQVGLSRLARYASASGISPQQINDTVIENFIAEVRENSLHRKPSNLHRMTSLIWNERARRPGLDLKPVTVPSFRRTSKRVEWTLFLTSFRKDADKYLTWCAGSDSFAADARPRVLAPLTLRLRRAQIHAAATALVEAGVKPSEIRSLADLCSPENFKHILRRRYETVGGRENRFNQDLATALVQIAREWVKVDAVTLAELRRLAGKVPKRLPGLSEKNKRFLRQFDDPTALQRLFDLPRRLWDEVKRNRKPNHQILAKAQAALAVAILSYMPLRMQNLAALTFDIHLFMHDGSRAISTLELAAGEVKNRRELAFDIPSEVAKMIVEYRNSIAPKVIGHRPDRLFVNPDGTPKHQGTVSAFITTTLRKRAGIVLTAHQFCHLSAKILLDAEPGSFETVRQLLGHASLNTTVGAYAGIDSRRAARHHQSLIEKARTSSKSIQ